MNPEELRRTQILTMDVKDVLFAGGYDLLPNSHDAWDWEMAFLEKQALSKEELVDRSAFFASVNGRPTYHYRMCSTTDTSIHNKKSIYTRSFFLANQFSTGYATHGLFPYRGKFHPQVVKGILNIIGVGTGDVVLDPMGGSFTTCLEAKMMGIRSIGIDLSPFCVLMGRAKCFAATLDLGNIDRLESLLPRILAALDTENNRRTSLEGVVNELWIDCAHVVGFRDLITLIFLDAMGYARRRKRKKAIELFPEVFARYLATIRSFVRFVQSNKPPVQSGDSEIHVGSVLDLSIQDESVDCVLTSPPYSFAIDYVDNDAPQLQFIGVDTSILKQGMIGLRGSDKEERIANYFADMALAFKEMGRVLKPGKLCVVIVGSNSIQTGGIRHEEEFRALAEDAQLELVRDMIKPIKGIQNTLHEEHVMFFRKTYDKD